MEKSIEAIWEEGFLNKDALVAPKLNNLYNQKSQHIVDRFKRMYEINVWTIVVFAILILHVSFLVEMSYLGMPMSVLFMAVMIVNRKLKKTLDKIDKSQNSYEYLSSFDCWIKEMVKLNLELSRYLYPYIFLSLIAGFWFGGFGGNILGEELVTHLVRKYPDMYMFLGLPVYGIATVIIGTGFLHFLVVE